MDGTSGRDLSQDPLTPSLSLDVGPLSSSSSSSDDSKQVSSTGARSSLTTSSLSTPSSIPTSDTASATLPTAVVTPSHHRIVSATVERVAGLVRSRSESSQVLQSIVSMTPTSFKTGVTNLATTLDSTVERLLAIDSAAIVQKFAELAIDSGLDVDVDDAGNVKNIGININMSDTLSDDGDDSIIGGTTNVHKTTTLSTTTTTTATTTTTTKYNANDNSNAEYKSDSPGSKPNDGLNNTVDNMYGNGNISLDQQENNNATYPVVTSNHNAPILLVPTQSSSSPPSSSSLLTISSTFWSSLKHRFMQSRWYSAVEEALTTHHFPFTSMPLASSSSSPRPAELFYLVLTEEFPKHDSLPPFLQAVKNRAELIWSDRLESLAKAYFVAASAVTKVVGASRFVGGAMQICRATADDIRHGIESNIKNNLVNITKNISDNYNKINNNIHNGIVNQWDKVLGVTDGMVDRYLPDNTSTTTNMTNMTISNHNNLPTHTSDANSKIPSSPNALRHSHSAVTLRQLASNSNNNNNNNVIQNSTTTNNKNDLAYHIASSLEQLRVPSARSSFSSSPSSSTASSSTSASSSMSLTATPSFSSQRLILAQQQEEIILGSSGLTHDEVHEVSSIYNRNLDDNLPSQTQETTHTQHGSNSNINNSHSINNSHYIRLPHTSSRSDLLELAAAAAVTQYRASPSSTHSASHSVKSMTQSATSPARQMTDHISLSSVGGSQSSSITTTHLGVSSQMSGTTTGSNSSHMNVFQHSSISSLDDEPAAAFFLPRLLPPSSTSTSSSMSQLMNTPSPNLQSHDAYNRIGYNTADRLMNPSISSDGSIGTISSRTTSNNTKIHQDNDTIISEKKDTDHAREADIENDDIIGDMDDEDDFYDEDEDDYIEDDEIDTSSNNITVTNNTNSGYNKQDGSQNIGNFVHTDIIEAEERELRDNRKYTGKSRVRDSAHYYSTSHHYHHQQQQQQQQLSSDPSVSTSVPMPSSSSSSLPSNNTFSKSQSRSLSHPHSLSLWNTNDNTNDNTTPPLHLHPRPHSLPYPSSHSGHASSISTSSVNPLQSISPNPSPSPPIMAPLTDSAIPSSSLSSSSPPIRSSRYTARGVATKLSSRLHQRVHQALDPYIYSPFTVSGVASSFSSFTNHATTHASTALFALVERLKQSLSSEWFTTVHEILMSNSLNRYLATSHPHASSPTDRFLKTCVEALAGPSSSSSVEAFIQTVKLKMGGSWDNRLLPASSLLYDNVIKIAYSGQADINPCSDTNTNTKLYNTMSNSNHLVTGNNTVANTPTASSSPNVPEHYQHDEA